MVVCVVWVVLPKLRAHLCATKLVDLTIEAGGCCLLVVHAAARLAQSGASARVPGRRELQVR